MAESDLALPGPGETVRDFNLVAYGFLRDEIKREDEITHQRSVCAFTFQGFLIAAASVLIAGDWAGVKALDQYAAGLSQLLVGFRLETLLGIGSIGFLVSVSNVVGIHASRLSIRDIRTKWEGLIAEGKVVLDERLPQAYGQGKAYRLGDLFPYTVASAFVLLWGLYLITFCARFLRLGFPGDL